MRRIANDEKHLMPGSHGVLKNMFLLGGFVHEVQMLIYAIFDRKGSSFIYPQEKVVAFPHTYIPGRRGGLMVSALDSRSGGPGSSPGRGTVLCSWARYFTLIVPLFTQVHK